MHNVFRILEKEVESPGPWQKKCLAEAVPVAVVVHPRRDVSYYVIAVLIGGQKSAQAALGPSNS